MLPSISQLQRKVVERTHLGSAMFRSFIDYVSSEMHTAAERGRTYARVKIPIIAAYQENCSNEELIFNAAAKLRAAGYKVRRMDDKTFLVSWKTEHASRYTEDTKRIVDVNNKKRTLVCEFGKVENDSKTKKTRRRSLKVPA